MRTRRVAAFLALLAGAAVAALAIGPGLRSALRGRVEAGTRLADPRASELVAFFRQGAARRAGRRAPPADPLVEGPRPLSELLPPLDEGELTMFFGKLGPADVAFDPVSYVARRPRVHREQWLSEHPLGHFAMDTNGLGLRRDAEVLPERPALRALVLGDSHVDGVVPNAESFCALIEARLLAEGAVPSAEVLDAGVGGSTFLNYLGTLQRFASLRPHVVVCTVYGGNDFHAQCVIERYLRGLEAPRRRDEAIARLLGEGDALSGILAQDLLGALYFLANPEDEQLASDAALEYLLAMRARCRELDARFSCVYLPPASAVQYERYREPYERALSVAGLERSVLDVSERLADRMLAGLARAGVPTVDLRPALRAADGDCYWHADLHLSRRGHALAAQALEPALLALADGRAR